LIVESGELSAWVDRRLFGGNARGITCSDSGRRGRGNVHRFRREKKPVIFFVRVGEDFEASEEGGLGGSTPGRRQDLSAFMPRTLL